jgi:hypothetical protein
MAFFTKLGNTPTKPETPTAAPTPPAPAARPPAPGAVAYGIDDALKLVRGLPFDTNPELVAFVMKNTLASLHVNVEDLANEATARQEAIRGRIAGLHSEIAQLEAMLQEKRSAVMVADGELSEVSSLRRRLETSTLPRAAPPMRQNTAPTTSAPAVQSAPAAPAAPPAAASAATLAAGAGPDEIADAGTPQGASTPMASAQPPAAAQLAPAQPAAPRQAPSPAQSGASVQPGANPQAARPTRSAAPGGQPAANTTQPGTANPQTPAANPANRNAGAGMRESPYGKN